MPTDQESGTEFKITAVCTITDSAERQRRLTEAFAHLLDFRHNRAASPTRERCRAEAVD